MKNTDPLMGTKLKLKTHLQNTFFWFFEPFFGRLASKFSKSANMTQKSRISRWFWIRWKSCKNAQKSFKQNKLTNMRKSEKSAYFRHVFANNFFVHFFKTFSTDYKSAWNSTFLIPVLNFKKQTIFLLFWALFVNFDSKCAGNGSKKRKIFVYKCILEFY